MDVMQRREKPERRLAKRRKVVSDDKEELAHEVRRVDMDVDGARQQRARARPKKRANRRMVTAEVSDSSVEATVAPIVNTSKVVASEVTRPVEIEGPLKVSIEVPIDIPAEPLKEGTELISLISLSSKQTQSTPGEETSQLKVNEDLEKESTLSEEILKQVDAWIGGTVVGAEGITLPTSPMEELQEKETECEVLQLNLAKESGRCTELEETCGELRKSNENAQKVTMDLIARLEKSREAYDEAVKGSDQLITIAEKREKNYIKELAKLEAKEVCIAEELRAKIVETKTAEEDLCSKISEIEEKCDMEFQRAEELSASMSARNQKYEEELADWAKKLVDCESARTSDGTAPQTDSSQAVDIPLL
ncbi:hypothetical protein AXG93_2356s1010 [Marchantia polymorpha subsp. ruderalis]|uniref:Uncharacterized protein n=1 Tax=Marchantia polymorpha subsp. ruderalis TaxID=1480154 RepID=A0A176WGG5_MARPO|nr:hypothetical protein AXG93_2356s1010 [Marchantia polymorpha subsp. ruderalis]